MELNPEKQKTKKKQSQGKMVPWPAGAMVLGNAARVGVVRKLGRWGELLQEES